MHIKRNEMPKTWPLPRKGTKFVVVPSHNKENSIPLLIILRDILQIVKNRKEAKKIINGKKVKINFKFVKDVKQALQLFDILTLDNKNFRVVFKNKKFSLQEIGNEETKISKIIGKKILKKNQIQFNFLDGSNLLVKEKAKVGDSIIINLKTKKIEKILPFKEKAKVIFIAGKHIGEEGKIKEIKEGEKLIKVEVEGREINAERKSLMVIS